MKKNIKNWFKRNRKFICMVLVMLIAISVISMFDNNVFGRLTNEEDLLQAEEEENIGDFFEWILSNLLSTAAGVLTGPFATLLTVLAFVLFLLLYIIFVASGLNQANTTRT